VPRIYAVRTQNGVRNQKCGEINQYQKKGRAKASPDVKKRDSRTDDEGIHRQFRLRKSEPGENGVVDVMHSGRGTCYNAIWEGTRKEGIISQEKTDIIRAKLDDK